MAATLKTLILAAGFGTRLRPYTNVMPKPMFTVGNKPLLEWTVETMKKQDCRDFIINLHYMPEKIKTGMGDGTRLGVNIQYSYEPEILGTGGAIKNLRGQLNGGRAFWLVNSDMLFDLNLTKAELFHFQNNALATMVLFKTPKVYDYGRVDFDENNMLSGIVPKHRPELQGTQGYIFTGIHIISPRIFDFMPEDKDFFCIVSDVYKKLMGREKIMCFCATGTWKDIGNPGEYLEANQYALDNGLIENKTASSPQITMPSMVGPGAVLEDGCRIGPYAVIGKNARVGKGSVVKQSVVWENARVPQGAKVKQEIVTDPPVVSFAHVPEITEP